MEILIIFMFLMFLVITVVVSEPRRVYTYKGKDYLLIKLHIKSLKNPETRSWVDVVEYVQVENNKTYFRESDEFFRLFKLEK